MLHRTIIQFNFCASLSLLIRNFSILALILNICCKAMELWCTDVGTKSILVNQQRIQEKPEKPAT